MAWGLSIEGKRVQFVVPPPGRDWAVALGISALAGAGVGAGVAAYLLRLFAAGWFGVAASTAAFGVATGLTIGILQHRVLRDFLPFLKIGSWVGWTLLGCAFTWLLLSFAIPGTTIGPLAAEAQLWLSPTATIVMIGGLGLIVGGCQAVALSQWVPRPWRWIVASTAAWIAAAPLMWLAAGPVSDIGPPLAPILAGFLVLVAGAVAGVVGAPLLPKLAKTTDDGEYAHDTLGDIGTINLSK